MIPSSLSICRGQADRGIGEAGTPIRRGEQYLAADAPLQADPQLLRGIRHWLTLDAGPGDHGRLQERLTGWACFPAGPYYFVVRLAAAGKYDRRDAYFAHARAWPLAAFSADFDPGLYLGQDAAFLTEAPSGATLAGLPPPLAPGPDPAYAAPEQALAVGLITHLFHGMVTGWPVILAVPVTAFAAESPLARVISFARGALPGRLRRRCRVRVFSRNPPLFLGPGQDPEGAAVDLLVIPEDLAGAALGAVRRHALLLDARGERCDGPAPAADLGDYARAAIESAWRFPAQLTAFGERFDRLWANPAAAPGPELTGWVTLTYNLTVALAGGEAHCGSLFANYLLTQARANAQVPWSALIRPGDWARFPQDHLIRFILRADAALSPGEGRLQAALSDAFQRLGRTLDEGLAAWWNPAEAPKRRRLLALCDLDPPLVSDARCAALTGPLSIATLAADGAPLTGALRAEYRAGVLGARGGEAPRLVALLDQPGLFALLLEADRTGVLAAPWRRGDLAAMPLPQAAALARQLLQEPRTWGGLDDLPTRLFARLEQAPGGLDAIAADLFDPRGSLRIEPTPAVAVLLLETAPIAQRLPCRDLMTLGARLPDTAARALSAYQVRVTALMDLEPQPTTAHLIQAGAWLPWRRHAGPALDQDARHRLALTWLTSPALAMLRDDLARTRPPQWRPDRTQGLGADLVDLTRETWDQVMADLGPLAPAAVQLLTRPDTHWPWVHPFQQDQARDLAARCTDPRARAALAADLERTAWRSAADAPWIGEVIAALAAGTGDDPALAGLRERVQAAADQDGHDALSHPLMQLCRAICALPPQQRRRDSPLIRHGWNTLERAIGGEGRYYHWALPTADRPLLPLLHLAACLRPERQAGTLALWFMYQPDCAPLRREPRWWEALIGSVLTQTAPPAARAAAPARPWCAPAEATRRAALALIDAEREALPAAEGMALARALGGPGQRRDLDRQLRSESPMNERLAFFCDRDTAPCHLHTWTDAGETGEALYQIWCRATLADPGPDAAGPAIDPANLAARVAAAGGGIIAVTRPTGTGAALRIATIPAAGYDPATEVLVLRPGQSPAWTPGDGAAIPADPGTFVLVPATRTDQSTLRAFLDQLDRLPDDYRSLLLNVLRRPGIEGALRRLERRLDRLHGDPTPGATDDNDARARGPRLAQAWPWLLTGLLVLNLLAVFGSAWWVKGSTGNAVPPGGVEHLLGASPPGTRYDWIAPSPPRPDWSSCGPPWFCRVPLAPGPSHSVGLSPPGAPQGHDSKQ